MSPFKLLFSNKYANIKIHRYKFFLDISIAEYPYIATSLWNFQALSWEFLETHTHALIVKSTIQMFCKVDNLHRQDFHFKQALPKYKQPFQAMHVYHQKLILLFTNIVLKVDAPSLSSFFYHWLITWESGEKQNKNTIIDGRSKLDGISRKNKGESSRSG